MRPIEQALQIFASAKRPMSAKDIELRMTTQCANPRKLTAILRNAGCIRHAFNVGPEKFFTAVPGAVAPPDERVHNRVPEAARRRKQKAQQ